MTRAAALAAAALTPIMLSGCVAAAIPVAAAGAYGAHKIDQHHHEKKRQPAHVRGRGVPPPGGLLMTKVPAEMQYLYGSAEAAAQQRQTYLALADFLIAKSSDRAVGHPVKSVVLAPGATLDHPVFESCGDKPLAVVLDADETVILNYGFESDQVLRGGMYDEQRWNRWEQNEQGKVKTVPGAVDAVAVARDAGIAVVINSNRLAANAAATEQTLKAAGLGTFKHLDTLWLTGDAGAGAAKDGRRWAISAKYCVIAMVGDQLGDFTDLFNERGLSLDQRRAAIGTREFEIMWGRGWFILPNPVYGTAIRGDYGAVFPLGMRWSDPGDIKRGASGSSN